jgi:phospholipase/carboxylesterase
MVRDERLSVIALHGLAASREEVDAVAASLQESLASFDIRWVFPRAPRRPVTILGGQAALAWYDILAYDRSRMDEGGIEEATAAVGRTVLEERERGFSGRKLLLMGFSQGGALALHAGLRLHDEVDGIVVLAAALPFPERIRPATPESPPIFFGHGLFDRRVPHSLGRDSCRLLKSRGYETEWRSYACGHGITPRLLRDVSGWLRRRILGAQAVAAGALAPGCGFSPTALDSR